MTDRAVISVFGSGEAPEGSAAYETARQVGRILGELGLTIATGGYAGTMQAVSQGAKNAGARVIGVTCRIWKSPPNSFVDEVVETEDLHGRLRALIEIASAGFVVLPGATGTLLELAAVWELANKGLAPALPIVCVGAFWRPLFEQMASVIPSSARCVAFADSPADLARHFRSL